MQVPGAPGSQAASRVQNDRLEGSPATRRHVAFLSDRIMLAYLTDDPLGEVGNEASSGAGAKRLRDRALRDVAPRPSTGGATR